MSVCYACNAMSMQAPTDDWRAQALRNLEASEREPLEGPPAAVRSDGYWAVLAAKLVFLVFLSAGLVCFGGWGFLAAPIFVTWLLFWPR